MKTLIVGATGLLGSNILKTFSQVSGNYVFGTIRRDSQSKLFKAQMRENLFTINDANNIGLLNNLFLTIEPDVVINCLSLSSADRLKKKNTDHNLYSKLPHKLSIICKENNARYIHISSDCVFSGKKGNYKETDTPDPLDIYGKSKVLGEVIDENSINIRTSFFGHTIERNYGLLDWFLGQDKKCFGYNKYIFSGMPAVILSMISRDVVVPNQEMKGLYNIGAPAISKYALLELIADVYQKSINVIKEDSIEVNRSLDSTKFFKESGYKLPSWREMIEAMHSFQ